MGCRMAKGSYRELGTWPPPGPASVEGGPPLLTSRILWRRGESMKIMPLRVSEFKCRGRIKVGVRNTASEKK